MRERHLDDRCDHIVDQLYRAILGRAADPVGLEHYGGRLRAGDALERIVADLLESPEACRRRVPRRDAFTDDPRFPLEYKPPGEAGRCYRTRVRNGFLARWCGGPVVLDVGYSGYDNPDRKAALPHAIGIDLDTPGYDGTRLPFDDGSVDTVFSSHCLEHILHDHAAIRDWYRVLKVGGFVVCMVPSQALYERKRFLPSRWNDDHKRMYTVSSLAESVERALDVNSYRVRHLAENDQYYDYSRGPHLHSDGAMEIELVIEKIVPPAWTLDD